MRPIRLILRESLRIGAGLAFVLNMPVVASAQADYQVATSADGVAATAHPLATFAAERVLEAGGNAADAAIAAAFSVAVVFPSMNSIGGRNQILVWDKDGVPHAIDGTTEVPRGYDPESAARASHGYETVGVPGAVAGLMKLHRDYASMPLPDLMSFAIGYAEKGFRLMPQEEAFHAMAVEDLRLSEGASRYFLQPDGTPYRAGDLLVQRDLGQTLRQLAEDGGESFYHGEIARRMSDDILDHGGYVTRGDLDQYRALDGRIVRGSYRGYELVGAGIPAAGAVSIQALQIMETFDRQGFPAEVWAAIAGQAIGLASSELGGLGTDSAAARATSKEWARAQAKKIILPSSHPGSEPHRGILSEASAVRTGHYTTHISVVDREGMAVALTQTVGPVMGARVATPGLGVHYAVTLGGYLAEAGPGARARSFISPLFVLKDGELVLVIGAAGGARIVASVVQVISRVIDDGMALPEALVAPRVFAGFDGTLEMETSGTRPWADAELEALRNRGWTVKPVASPIGFALVQALLKDPETGMWTAVSEPDGEGAAAGVRRLY